MQMQQLIDETIDIVKMGGETMDQTDYFEIDRNTQKQNSGTMEQMNLWSEYMCEIS